MIFLKFAYLQFICLRDPPDKKRNFFTKRIFKMFGLAMKNFKGTVKVNEIKYIIKNKNDLIQKSLANNIQWNNKSSANCTTDECITIKP